MKKILIIVLLMATLVLPPRTSLAGSTENGRGTFFRYGLGLFEKDDRAVSSTKLFSFGFVDDLIGPIVKQYEVGAYFDNSSRPGATGSAFANASIGLDVRPGYFVIRSLWGVGAITSPDVILGGWFQFNQDFYAGVVDSSGTSIGLNYKHISSAGIYKPNKGRDFVTIQVSIPW